MRLLAACLLAAGTLCLPALARANGRFPEAQRLLEHPHDSNRLYLAGTYGLLVTENRGQSWHYVCEQSFALETLEGDPLLEILPDGAILGGMKDELTRSDSCGCSWQPVLAQTDSQNVVDITQDSGGSALALVQDTSTFPSTLLLFESKDEGATWQSLPAPPADLPSAFTIDVAPSDPQRIYISAYSPSAKTGVLAVSENRGQSWNELPIISTGSTASPYIAAVHPTNSNLVFVRTRVNDGSADYTAQDSLLVSDNAGTSWSEALHKQAMLLGFALSPDGSTVLAGYGDSISAGLSTNPDDLGIYRASTSDLVFQQIYAATITCLRWTARGVYACTVQDGVQVLTPGMSVGFAPNANFTLANTNPLTPLLDLHAVRGPLGCTAATCADSWQTGGDAAVAVCQQLAASCTFDAGENIVCPVPNAPDGGAADASAPDAGPDASPSGAGGANGNAAGGSGGSSGASSGTGPVTASGAAPSQSADTGKKGGCGCRLASRSNTPEALGAGLLAALALCRLRRRR